MTTANEVREFVLKEFIEPARKQGKRTVSFTSSDVHRGMSLKQRYPLVCSAIDADKFLDFAKVTLVKREGPKQSSTAKWLFSLR